MSPILESAPLVAAPVASYAAPLAVHGPVASSSYSVSTQHVSAPVVSHYAAPLAAPLVAHASYGAPLVSHASYGAPLVSHASYAAPVAYATKGYAAAPLISQELTHW